MIPFTLVKMDARLVDTGETRSDLSKSELLKLLKLRPDASLEDVRRRVLSMNCLLHPDKNPLPEAAERVAVFNDIYSLLKSKFSSENFETWVEMQVSIVSPVSEY